jgi:hypothetical protein
LFRIATVYVNERPAEYTTTSSLIVICRSAIGGEVAVGMLVIVEVGARGDEGTDVCVAGKKTNVWVGVGPAIVGVAGTSEASRVGETGGDGVF